MNRRLLLLMFFASEAASGCHRPLTPDQQTQWARDSTRYAAAMAVWSRDSTVIDSISRSINTDSLYHLNRTALHATETVPILREINCETKRLAHRYGQTASWAAIQRMQDTLWHPSEKDDVARMNGRVSGMSTKDMVAMGSRQYDCGPLGPGISAVDAKRLTQGHPIPPTHPR